ncbi:unnamed protein product [Peronospora farinosa]|uniref:Protein kinase domain-containing protein n=1 Tax=Peronospora farinosa TaxID=134698 RepID=A0AAV0U837_9STRA|nr:unnamed protein product [Peronospora farinosa]CAI5715852.1 unnamed protein product [Peronospora farinosa]CAI5719433.1 unnamed protein product [Peronospora farinosa]CAI5732997.1 unnamed protein product [Peronospora farinosa]
MTLRQQGVLCFIVCLVGIAVVSVAAQDSGDSSIPRVVSALQTGEESYYTKSSTSGLSNEEDADETAAYIARGYASTMDENEQRLTIINDALLMESVCDGNPVVILKSTTVPANGACLPAQSRYNLSCSCLSGFANKTLWEFHVRAPDGDAISPFPTTFSDRNIVQVNSLMLLDVPSDLLILKIQGESSDLVPVHLEKATTGDDSLALVRSQEVSALTKVDLYNLDLVDVPIEVGFVPATVSNLLIRRCNLNSIGQLFLESLTALESLNLASNKISSIYTRLPGSVEALNAMTEINLANNSFTEFPRHLLQFPNLQKIDLSGNAITNLTVTSDEFAIISQLLVFRIDVQGNFNGSGSDCEREEVHSTVFCVSNSTRSLSASEMALAQKSADNATNWTAFMLVAAFGGCIVGFLLFFLAIRLARYQQEHQIKPGSASPNAVDIQTPGAMETTASQAVYNTLHPTLHAGILDDPLIMSFRLNYKDVEVGRCISKGGFGLVYTGTYKRRRVAIKKIMREKCEKLSQIRMFVREITLMGSLKHERIVEFIGVAWDSLRNLSAVTEYMERGDLRDVLHTLKHEGSEIDDGLTWHGLKLTIALHIAEGLAYMHSLNPKVIHRDLKSKNVLLNDEFHAKLSDFGVSRERPVADVEGVPEKFMTPGVGTSFWIAPEVLLGKDYDEHADIFSFGVVLSELDTDDYPYWNSGNIPGQGNLGDRRSQEQKILEKVALGSLRPTFYNDCPPGVLSLAASCLEGKAENRPSASEVVLAIQELIREMQFDNPDSEPEPDEIVTAGFLSSEYE